MNHKNEKEKRLVIYRYSILTYKQDQLLVFFISFEKDVILNL